jgi:putative ABC transport system ATP-binding protein
LSDTLLIAHDLRREYHMGEELVRAVRGVSLHVERGEYLAIVGPSGCGKSTLLNLIGGIDQPTAGTVTIDGARIDQMSDTEVTRFRLRHVGFVFQRFYLMPALTAIENVELPMAEAKTPRVERMRRARDRDALLLATRQLRRSMIGPVGETDVRQ